MTKRKAEKLFDSEQSGGGQWTDEQLAAIPAKRGVMLLEAGDGRPIVAMTAADMRARLLNRLRKPDPDERKKLPNLRQITERVSWKLAYSHFETDLQFLEIALHIWPRRYATLLAIRPAWFVHCDVYDPSPTFQTTRDVCDGKGQHVGPFSSSRQAQHYIDILQDAFDLCRDPACLARAPDGQRCTYAQMHRCPCPCDGSVSIDAYRQLVVMAADVAAGRRQQWLGELTGRMQTASAAMEFELAGAIKTAGERLAELDGANYANVAPLEQFRFIILQRGRSSRQANVFFADAGRIQQLKPIDYPTKSTQLVSVVKAADRLAAQPHEIDEAAKWRISLLSRYLYMTGPARGVIHRYEPALEADQLAEWIEDAKAELRLKLPAVRKPKPAKKESSGPQGDKQV